MKKILALIVICLTLNIERGIAAECDVWNSNEHYGMCDIVTYYDEGYECVVYDVWYWPPTDTRYWIRTDECNGAPEICYLWSPDRHYSMGNKVTYFGQSYECVVYDVWYWPPTDTRYWIETDECEAPPEINPALFAYL